MYPCEHCGLFRDGKSRYNNSGMRHDCLSALKAEVERLRAVISQRVGDERPGDTLIRLSKLVLACRVVDDVGTADWRSWLSDFGERLNAAAEAGGE